MITVTEIKSKAEQKYNREFLLTLLEDFFVSNGDGSNNGSSFSTAGVSNNNCDVNNNARKKLFPMFIAANKGKVTDDILTRAKELEPLIENSKEKIKYSYTLETEQKSTHSNGTQTAIKKIFFESEKDLLIFLKKQKETECILGNLACLQKELKKGSQFSFDWCTHHINDLRLERKTHEKNFWHEICLCVNYFLENKNCNLYAREIPIAVHTKFIENNARLIHSLLSTEKFTDFPLQHGLKTKPKFIRFRFLAKNCEVQMQSSLQLQTQMQPLAQTQKYGTDFCPSEYVLSSDDFILFYESGFLEQVQKIIIVENEIVYLTFPPIENYICVWGHGYTALDFEKFDFLSKMQIIYFGDLDEHGFDILSGFRKIFPSTKSLCMDSETLQKFDIFRCKGTRLASSYIPKNLTDSELTVFMSLRNASDEHCRLEQERVTQEWIEKYTRCT